MEYPGQRNGGDHFSRIDVAFVFSVEGFGEIGGSRDNREEDGSHLLKIMTYPE